MASVEAAMAMPSLWIFNWTPWALYLSLNGRSYDQNPVKPSVVDNEYFPWSVNTYPRDLSLNTGTPTKWGRSNRLVVNFEEVSQALDYSDLEDPIAISSADMYLWVFVNFVVFSQQSSFLKEVMPDP